MPSVKPNLQVSSLSARVMMTWAIAFSILSPLMLTGCDTNTSTQQGVDDPNITSDRAQLDAKITELTLQKPEQPLTNSDRLTESNLAESNLEGTADIIATDTRREPLDIDWSQVATGVKAVNKANFNYPFAIDSDPVNAYADYFKVSKPEAQHSLTIGTASNEPLSALLTQLGNSYVSHELTDGTGIKLIVHTMPNVSASSYDYVIANDFAKGLVLPIEIRPDFEKSK